MIWENKHGGENTRSRQVKENTGLFRRREDKDIQFHWNTMIQNPNELETEVLSVMNEDNRPSELSTAPGVENSESNAEGNGGSTFFICQLS